MNQQHSHQSSVIYHIITTIKEVALEVEDSLKLGEEAEELFALLNIGAIDFEKLQFNIFRR